MAQVWHWIGFSFFLLTAAALSPSWCGLFSLLSAVLLFPPLQPHMERHLKRPIRITALILCVMLTTLFMLKEANVFQNTPTSVASENITQQDASEQAEKAPTDKPINTPFPANETHLPTTSVAPTIKPLTEPSFAVHYCIILMWDKAMLR